MERDDLVSLLHRIEGLIHAGASDNGMVKWHEAFDNPGHYVVTAVYYEEDKIRSAHSTGQDA